MREHVTLFWGIFYRDLVIYRRYPLDTLSYVGLFFLYFAVLFLGGRAVMGGGLGGNLSALVVGFFVWTLTQTSFIFLSNKIYQEAKRGTLEQLYISPFRFSTVMFMSALSNVITSTGIALVNLGFVLVLTGKQLVIHLSTIVPLFAFTVLSAIGFGFVFAGLALVYKRVRSLIQIVQFLFVGLISAAYTDVMPLRLLPVTQGTAMIHSAMVDGKHLLEFPPMDLLLLVGTAAGHLGIGYLVFYWAQRRVRKLGALDEY